MKVFLKKLTLIAICVSIFMSLTGCYSAVKPDKDPKKLVQDVKRTDQIKKEKDLISGQVYVRNNMVTATMLFKDTISEKDAKDLVNKYTEALKKEYKGMKINIQAVQKGKNIANVIIEK
jgi:outer membrane murein-binding lipoprotein Lpp